MSKATAIFGLWVGFCASVYFALYIGLIQPFFIGVGAGGNEAFIAFCSLAVFFGMDGNPGKALSFSLSGVCGAVWGWIFFSCVGILMPLVGGSFIVAGFIDITILTGAAIFVHTFLLRNTMFNGMAFVFVGVATTFSGTAAPGVWGIVNIAFLIICGVLIGTASTALAPKIFGPPPVSSGE
jgi:hypothetical protein